MSHILTLVVLILFATFITSTQSIPYDLIKSNDTNYVHGVDLSQPCSAGGFNCLKNQGYQFAVVRCYQSLGRVDPNCAASVKAAWAGGISYVDVYVFPCQHCGNGKKQVEDTVASLKASGAKFGMLWLDIEGPNEYWSTNQATNHAFFEELLAGIRSTGVKAGIYTSKSQWGPIMGLDYSRGSAYPLWYAHYNNDPSMSDFAPFGGWGRAAIKQYKGSTALCGCGVDLNAY